MLQSINHKKHFNMFNVCGNKVNPLDIAISWHVNVAVDIFRWKISHILISFKLWIDKLLN